MLGNPDPVHVLRTMALAALMAGAAVAAGSTLYAGRHNEHIFLTVLFVGWALSPFAALLATDRISRLQSLVAPTVRYGLMLTIAAGSAAGYTLWNPPGVRPAFLYLMVPLIAWVVTVIIVFFAGRPSRKN